MPAPKGKRGAGGDTLGSFAMHAHAYYQAGMMPVPCNAKTKRVSLKEWKPYQSERACDGTVAIWAEQYHKADIGIITGASSGVTVVDCDNPKRSLASLEKQFGRTPYVVRTPRGGMHLYYRCNGEKTHTKILPDIDIRGQGGFVIAPPSYNAEIGASYTAIKGTLDDLRALPTITSGALPCIENNTNLQGNKRSPINEGERNNRLFFYLKNEVALKVDTYEALLGFARSYCSENFSPSLPDKEIERTAKQVWQYKEKGKLFTKGHDLYTIPVSGFVRLSARPDALVLWLYIRRNHAQRKGDFTISQEEVSGTLGWSGRKAIRKAIGHLMSLGMIERTHIGKGKGDPHRYRFTASL